MTAAGERGRGRKRCRDDRLRSTPIPHELLPLDPAFESHLKSRASHEDLIVCIGFATIHLIKRKYRILLRDPSLLLLCLLIYFLAAPGFVRGVPILEASPRSLTPSARSSLARRAGLGTTRDTEVKQLSTFTRREARERAESAKGEEGQGRWGRVRTSLPTLVVLDDTRLLVDLCSELLLGHRLSLGVFVLHSSFGHGGSNPT
jgi:hypothetical protein